MLACCRSLSICRCCRLLMLSTTVDRCRPLSLLSMLNAGHNTARCWRPLAVAGNLMHGQGVSSLRLGTLGARSPSPPPQVSANESKVEKHEPKNKKRYARSLLSTRRCDNMMHGQGVSSLRLGTLGANHTPQVSAKESSMEEHKPNQGEVALSLEAGCNFPSNNF